MRRLDYHIIVQSDEVVQAILTTADGETTRERGRLDLSDLETITGDLLPLLEKSPQHGRDFLKRFGQRLYRMLFAGDIRGHFEQLAWRKAVEYSDEFCLTLALTFQEELRADVAALPWESVFCRRGNGRFLATDPRVALSRRPMDWLSQAVEPRTDGQALRVMLVRLQPEDMQPVALTQISNFLDELAGANSRLVPPKRMENPSALDMEGAAREYQPHIFHLLAHGRFNDRGTSFALVDGSGQEVRWYTDQSLADLFQAFRPRLVLLHACEGGRQSDVISFGNGAAWLVRGHIPAVVAMRFPITNDVACTFARTLYRMIVDGEELDIAVQGARRVLATSDQTSPEDHSTRDFAAPVLWMRQARPAEDREKPMMSLTIKTPDGARYAAHASPDTSVGQLLQTFLSQWLPSAATSQELVDYRLQPDRPNATPLQNYLRLEETEVADEPELLLTARPLDLDSPMALTVEDEQGQRFVTAVSLRTSTRQLAEAFFKDKPGTGEIVAERLDEPPGAETPQRLSLDIPLIEQWVRDESILRLYRLRETTEEES